MNPIPSRTRPLNSSAPMVLSLKAWESRSLPGLPRMDILLTMLQHKSRRGTSRRLFVVKRRSILTPDDMTATTIEPLLQQAIALHRQGALAEAAGLYSQVLQIEPVNPEALYQFARMHCQQDRFEQGIAFSLRSLASDPKQARVHNLIGCALYRMGRRDEALVNFDQAVSLQSEFTDAHENRGNLLSEFGRLAEAIESYDRALALRPDSVNAWRNRGIALHELGRHADAVASFDCALALKPDAAELHGNRADALVALGRYDEALASYDTALTLAPHAIDALHNRGVLFNKMERFQDALACFDQVLKIKPDLADAWNNAGNALRGLNRP